MSYRAQWATDAELQEIKQFQNSLAAKNPMNRTYENIVTNTAKIFVGREVERTPYFGQQTLFVVGSPEDNVDLITTLAKTNNCQHIFFGANHSYEPETFEQAQTWKLAIAKLATEFNVSIDVGSSYIHYAASTGLNLIPNICIQFRLEIPNCDTYNDLTMVKIDDRGFRYSNPGIWTHKLTDLKTPTAFTNWQEYERDRIVQNNTN